MIFDAVILAAILLSAVIAALRGFIREMLTIIGVVGGLAAAFIGGPVLQPVMRGWLGVKEGEQQKLFDILPMTIVADILAYGSIFILVVIILTVLSHFMATGAKAIGLGPVDRILGVLFGIVRAVLLMALLYLPVYLLVQEQERDDWFKGSHTRPHIEKTASWIASIFPSSVTEGEGKETDAEAGDDTGRKAEEISRRLDEMNMLKQSADRANKALDAARGNLQDAPPQPEPAESSGQAGNGDGYRPDQRETLDSLIEETGH